MKEKLSSRNEGQRVSAERSHGVTRQTEQWEGGKRTHRGERVESLPDTSLIYFPGQLRLVLAPEWHNGNAYTW